MNHQIAFVETNDCKLHHIGFVVPCIEEVANSFAQSICATWEGGVIHDPHQVVRVAFFRGRNSTDPLVELVEPAGATSPVHCFLKRGGGLHHLCYEVKALDKHLEFMGLTFGKIVRPPLPAIAFGGRRIAWVFTKNKLLLEFLER